MDTRNYDEPFNCGLEDCDCSEVNKCGCTFPNNVAYYGCSKQDRSEFTEEPTNDQGEPMIDNQNNASSNVDKSASSRQPQMQSETESVCICSKDECDCSGGSETILK